MKTLIAIFSLIALAAPAFADNCGGSFQLIQQQAFVPVQRNVIVQQQAFVPVRSFAVAPAFGFQRSFNLSINRGFAFAPAAVPFRSFNLNINRGFAPRAFR